MLQTAIRKAFEECTVLTIAHRLHTVMDSTEIMLFEVGSTCRKHRLPRFGQNCDEQAWPAREDARGSS